MLVKQMFTSILPSVIMYDTGRYFNIYSLPEKATRPQGGVQNAQV